jgi:hypothetical protein
MVKSQKSTRRCTGHLIRRAHQLAVAVFMEETAGFDATPVQFAILNALMDSAKVRSRWLAAWRLMRPMHVVGDCRLEVKALARREAGQRQTLQIQGGIHAGGDVYRQSG